MFSGLEIPTDEVRDNKTSNCACQVPPRHRRSRQHHPRFSLSRGWRAATCLYSRSSCRPEIAPLWQLQYR